MAYAIEDLNGKKIVGTFYKKECKNKSNRHCVEIFRIRSFYGPYFPAFGLNTERCRVSLRIYSVYGNIRSRKTPSTDTFHAVRVHSKKTNREKM